MSSIVIGYNFRFDYPNGNPSYYVQMGIVSNYFQVTTSIKTECSYSTSRDGSG